MANWWGNMSGSQAVQMGMNIFNMAQQQRMQQEEMEKQAQQQQQENFFRKASLDIQQQRADLEAQRVKGQQDVEAQSIQTAKDRSEYYKQQRDEATQKQQKLNEFSLKASEMIQDMDWTNQKSWNDLYALQVKYQPYGVTPKYIDITKEAGKNKVTEKEYMTKVMDMYRRLSETYATQYQKEMDAYTRGKLKDLPQLYTPSLAEAAQMVDAVIKHGENPEDVNIDELLGVGKEEEAAPEPTPQQYTWQQLGSDIRESLGQMATPKAVGKTLASGGMYPSYKAGEAALNKLMQYAGGETQGAIQSIGNLFNSPLKRYNELPASDKRAVDIWVNAMPGRTVEEGLQMLDEMKTLKAE